MRQALRHLGLTRAEVDVTFVGPRTMRDLNRTHRGKDSDTDVLSFPLWQGPQEFPTDGPLPLGDIVINPTRAKQQAKEYGATFKQEVARLLVHGLLHLMGYDHEQGAAHARRMRAKEKALLKLIA